MTTLLDHESGLIQGQGQPVFLRLVRYMRPYIGLVALTFALTVLYGGGRFGRAYLMKPILDDILLPSGVLQAEEADASSWLPSLPIPGLTGESPEAGAEVEAAVPRLDPAQKAKLEERIRESFVQVLGLAAIIILGMPIVTFARDYLILYALGRIDLDMKVDVCGKLLALPLRVHREQRQGDVMARVMADLALAHGALSLLFSKMFESAVMILVGGAALFLISWRLALVMMILGPLVFGVILVMDDASARAPGSARSSSSRSPSA